MLTDAVRAEAFRLIRNRGAVFWSVLFVPVATLILGVLTVFLTKARETEIPAELQLELGMGGDAVNLGHALVSIVGDVANPGVLLFVAMGAASVWAGDYRWETWRLISARNSRPNLILAKLGVVAGLAFAAMVALTLFMLAYEMIRAGVFERPLTFSLTGAEIGDMATLWALNWLRIIQVTVLGLFVAVLSRSLLAALFVPLVAIIVWGVLPQLLAMQGFMPTSWLTQLLSPDAAFSMLKAMVLSNPDAPSAALGEMPFVKAGLSATLWTLAPIAGALVLFQRQDLSKE